MAWAGDRRPARMRGPRIRAWGRMDTVLPGRWRRRRAEELQVPGDAVSPPGAWACGMGRRSPRGMPHWASRLHGGLPGTRHGRGRARALLGGGWGQGQGAGPRRCPALSPSGRACAETWEPGAACAALPEGPDPVSLTRARPRSVRAAAPESCPPSAGAGLGGVGLRG